MRRHAQDVLCLVLLALALCCYYHDALWGKGCFIIGDYAPQDIPNRHYFSQALRHGELPLWTPEMDCGWPMYAEAQAGLFYPLNWLFCLGPVPKLFSLSVVFHVFLGGAGTYLFARTLGVGCAGALLAGCCISFSPIFNAEEGCANFVCSAAWIPIVGAVFRLALVRRSRRYLLVASLAFALQFLAGHPYCTWYGLLVVLFVALSECWAEPPYRRRIVYVFSRLAWWGIIAAGLCAVQLLPMARLISESARSQGISEEVIASGLSPVAFKSILSPNYLGSFRTVTWYADVQKDQLLFMGITAICLAPFGLLSRPRKTTTLLLLMGVFGCLACFEGEVTLVPKFLALAPPMNMFRHRASYVMLAILATALLSGRGLECLLDQASRHRADKGGLPPPGMTLWWVLVALVFVGGLAALAHHWAARESFMPPERSYPPDPEVLQRKLEIIGTGRARDLICLAVFWGLAWATLVCGLLGFFRRTVLAGLLLAQQFISVVFLGVPSPGLIDPVFFDRVPRVLQQTVRKNPQGRVYSQWYGSPGEYAGAFKNPRLNNSLFDRNADLVSYNLGLFHGVDFVNAVPGPLRISRYTKLGGVAGATGNPHLLGLLQVRYVLTALDFPVRVPGLRLVYDQEVRAYENEYCLPRAFLVGNVRTVPDAAAAWKAITAATFSPRRTAVLEPGDTQPPPNLRNGNEPGTATILNHRRESVEIEVQAETDAVLVLLDTYYRGWTATVDGEAASIYRTNYLFRGVHVPKGTYRVVFRYVDWPFRAGATITLTTLALVLLILQRGRKTGYTASRSQPRRTSPHQSGPTQAAAGPAG